jgi:DNA-binding MarR family transcriptional regulator
MVISLTRAGWELFRAAVLEAEVGEAGIFEPLTEAERSTLAALLEKALAGGDPDRRRRRVTEVRAPRTRPTSAR